MIFAVVRKFEEGAKAIEISQQSVTAAQEKMFELVEQFTGLTKQIEQHQAGSKQDISSIALAVGNSNDNTQQVIAEWRKKHEEILRQLEIFAGQSAEESEKSIKIVQELLQRIFPNSENKSLIHSSVNKNPVMNILQRCLKSRSYM